MKTYTVALHQTTVQYKEVRAENREHAWEIADSTSWDGKDEVETTSVEVLPDLNPPKYFLISGYWKDNNETFEDRKVSTQEDDLEDDDDLFFYGVDEEWIKSLINNEDSGYEFVLTSYKPL